MEGGGGKRRRGAGAGGEEAEDGSDGGGSKVQRLLQRALHGQGATTAAAGGAAAAAGAPAAAAGAPAAAPGVDEDDDDELLAAVPSELMTALLTLRTQLAARRTGLPPVVLRTQLRSMLTDGTDTDRELDRLRRDNTLRVFKLNTGPDEHALLLTRDYVQLVCQAAEAQAQAAAAAAAAAATSGLRGTAAGGSQRKRQRQKQQREGGQEAAPPHVAVARALCARVLPHHFDMAISHAQLLRLLAATPPEPEGAAVGRAGPQRTTARGVPTGGPAPDLPMPTPDLPPQEEQVSLLMQVGALSRHTGDVSVNTYVLTVPGLGPVVKAVVAARRELQGLLARKQYQEAPERLLLEKAKLRSSPALGVAFHLRDMLGLGLVQRIDTTVGPIIRLLKTAQPKRK